MTKKIFVFLLVTLMLGVVLAGCGGSGTEQSGSSEPRQETVVLRIGSGSTGSQFHTIGVLLADMINQELSNYRASGEPSDMAVDNIRRMDRGEFEMGVSWASNVYWADNRQKIFEDELYDLNILISGHSAPWVLIAREDSGINSWADMRGKRLAGPPPGGLIGWELTHMALDFYGLTVDDLAAAPATTNMTDAVDQIRAGDLDCIFWPVNRNNVPAILDLASTTSLRWVGLEDALVDVILQDLPFLDKATVPAGSNEGQKEDFSTLSEIMQIMIRPDIDEDIVYEVTGALVKNLHRFQEVIGPTGDEWTIEQAVISKDLLNYHPGAIRYYQEQGVW